MGLTILLLGFIGLTVIGVPVAFGLGIASIAAFLYEGISPAIGFQRVIAGVSIYSLLAVPFFVFAGDLMLHGGIAERLIRFSSALLGRVRGGLGIVNVFSSMLFGGISGSAVADTSAIGSTMIPMMKKHRYDADYSVNVTVTSSVSGVLIPPSHNMVLYAMAAGGGVSISSLFLAGILPGMLVLLAVGLVAYLVAVKRGYQGEPFPGMRATLRYALAAIPGALTGVIILGGVLGGIVTVTEAAAAGVIYALVVTTVAMRTLKWDGFLAAVKNSAQTTAMVMVLVGTASSFAYLMAMYQVPAQVLTLVTGISDSPIVIFLLMNLALLVLGTVMDMAPLILISTPIFLPVALELGMDPVQFGMMLLLNLGIGLVTPPVGACLFVGCVIGKLSMEGALRSIWPFYLALFVALMAVTFIPELSLFLPRVFGVQGG